jgi:hypothetical protein
VITYRHALPEWTTLFIPKNHEKAIAKAAGNLGLRLALRGSGMLPTNFYEEKLK